VVSQSSKPDKSKLEQAIGYRFKDSRLLDLALTHKSVSKENNNDRLEFLGDAILGFLMAKELYKQRADTSGRMSLLRSSLVKGQNLTRIARTLQLDLYLQTGPSWRSRDSKAWARALEDALEALIGAVYLDGGIEATDKAVFRLFARSLRRAGQTSSKGLKNPQAILQEHLQAKGAVLPQYTVKAASGQQNLYFGFCGLPDSPVTVIACGASKSAARYAAALTAIDYLGLVDQDS